MGPAHVNPLLALHTAVCNERDYGWRRCAYHGPGGMERWLSLGVLASNLRRIALAKRG